MNKTYIYNYDSVKVWLNREMKKIKLNTNYYFESRGGLMIGIASDSNMIYLALDTTHITGYDTHIASIQQIITARNAYLANCRKNDSTTIGRWDDGGGNWWFNRIYKKENKTYYQVYTKDSIQEDEELITANILEGTKYEYANCPEIHLKDFAECPYFIFNKSDSSLITFVKLKNLQKSNYKVSFIKNYLYNNSPLDSFFYTPNQH